VTSLSPTSSEEKYTGPYRKPRPDLYTVMLIVALLAMLVAVVMLYYERGEYQFKNKGAPSVSRAPAAIEPATFGGRFA
jgi:uncharacterized membrane protein